MEGTSAPDEILIFFSDQVRVPVEIFGLIASHSIASVWTFRLVCKEWKTGIDSERLDDLLWKRLYFSRFDSLLLEHCLLKGNDSFSLRLCWRKMFFERCFNQRISVPILENFLSSKLRLFTKDGVWILLDSLYYFPTYGGLLLGTPDHKMNEERISKARKGLPQLWGPRPTHVVPPKRTLKRLHSPMPPIEILPDLQVVVWFTGPAIGDGDGSELVLVFWVDSREWYRRGSFEVLSDIVLQVPYLPLAEDFIY